MLIIYVIGCPLAALTILFVNRNRLDKPEALRYILLLYQGLKHSCFYWELVNTARKCLLLGLHVFIPDSLRVMKALFGVLTLFILSLLQARLKPFKISVINTLGKLLMTNVYRTQRNGIQFSNSLRWNRLHSRTTTRRAHCHFLWTHCVLQC